MIKNRNSFFVTSAIRIMHNLRRIDLNLLVTLHALLVERHVSRAAVRLHRSQPAVSHALANLRGIFNDPLLIRKSGKVVLTAKAYDLLQPLTETLGQLDTLLGEPTFEPANTQRNFRLAMSDYGAQVVLPALVRTLRSSAPSIDLSITQASREAMLANVIDGEVDIALGVFPDRSNIALQTCSLFEETFACLADSSTLPEDGRMDLESWISRPHVAVFMRLDVSDEVDLTCRNMGISRRLAVALPHWGVANDLIAGTDLILTVARRNLYGIDKDPRVRVFDPPIYINPFDFVQVWHVRRENDPAHRWLRDTIFNICKQN